MNFCRLNASKFEIDLDFAMHLLLPTTTAELRKSWATVMSTQFKTVGVIIFNSGLTITFGLKLGMLQFV